MAIRTMKVECIVPPDRRDTLRELCVQCQRLQNRLWQIWLCHHSAAGSAAQLRHYYDAARGWYASGKAGKRPEWPCRELPADLTNSKRSSSFYRILSSEFPMLASRTRGLAVNAWQSKLRKRKAANGCLPGWVSILFANESLPSTTKPQPVPFDHQNSKLRIGEGCAVMADLRIDRDPTTGVATVDSVLLLLNKRKARNARVVVDRIVAGDYKWKGSGLMYDRGKFYCLLSYELPCVPPVAIDIDRVMYIRPARCSPLRYRVTGERSRPYGGDGILAASMRERIENERRRRQEHNRHGGSNRRGHGGRHARAIWAHLSSRWKDGVKRYNHEVTTRLVRKARELGCGRIVYLQPTGVTRMTRLLSMAGAREYTRTSWDYFQIGTMLAYKCEQVGIAFGKPPKTQAKTKVRQGKRGGARKPAEITNEMQGEV